MIKTILIANRGEIASRIIKTCNRLGIISVVVYADPDKDLPFVQQADIAIALGGNQASESYLVQDKIFNAARNSNADAIHPGFGFLSENGDFARRCEAEGFVFIGPNPNAIDAMGLKSTAKEIMEKNGVPVIKGYRGKEQSVDFLVKKADEVGYPILVKAVAGGGGKGMRIANNADEIRNAVQAAKNEATNAFGNDELMLERYFYDSRHIEFQIFGDQHSNVVHLLERECSIQRRYQKVIEESPAQGLGEELRTEMGRAAVAAAQAINYDNAGTVEFILTPENEFFFLEVNTRLQVEHPVTEMITGLDLVEWQILVAEGKNLPLRQNEITATGHAIECRLYAEDALNNFFPETGTISLWNAPEIPGVRYETGVCSGSEVSIYFDPMLAKIIVHEPDRLSAIRKMDFALKNLKCLGVCTNQPFLIEMMVQPDFIEGKYTTGFIAQKFDFEAFRSKQSPYEIRSAIACLIFRWKQREDSRSLIPTLISGWRNQFYQKQEASFLLKDEKITLLYHVEKSVFYLNANSVDYNVELIDCGPDSIRLNINKQQHHFYICAQNKDYFIHNIQSGQIKVTLIDRYPDIEKELMKGAYEAPMPGEVLNIAVQVGQEIEEGQNLVTLLSMKMENTIASNESGIVEEILIEEGDSIAKGTLLLKIKS